MTQIDVVEEWLDKVGAAIERAATYTLGDGVDNMHMPIATARKLFKAAKEYSFLKEELDTAEGAVSDLMALTEKKDAKIETLQAQLKRAEDRWVELNIETTLLRVDNQTLQAQVKDRTDGWRVAFDRAIELQDDVQKLRKELKEAEEIIRDLLSVNNPYTYPDAEARLMSDLRASAWLEQREKK